MKKSGRAVFLIAGVLLSLVFLAGCVSPQQNSLVPANSSGALQNVSAGLYPAFIDTNSSLSKLPPEIQHEMWPLTLEYHFGIDKWEFIPNRSNEINLYAHDIRNESLIKEVQGKQIGNYTIHIIRDIEFETTRSEVRAYLNDLMKDPDYQISNIGMISDPYFLHESPSANYTGHYVELWCWDYTPKNKKLDNTMIKGWKILVYPMSPLPTNPPFTTRAHEKNSSNTSS